MTFPKEILILNVVMEPSLPFELRGLRFFYQHILEVISVWIEYCFIVCHYFCHIISTSFVTQQFMFTVFKWCLWSIVTQITAVPLPFLAWAMSHWDSSKTRGLYVITSNGIRGSKTLMISQCHYIYLSWNLLGRSYRATRSIDGDKETWFLFLNIRGY